jgi:predicted MFS family arabinose efflux permease
MSGASPRWVLASMTLAAFAAAIAMTSMAVAVPALGAHWSLGQDRVHWVTSGFIAAMIPAMLVTPWLLARFGERTTCVGALVLLVIGGVAGSLAPSFGALVAARLLEGAAAGVLQPLPMIVVSHRFHSRQRGTAMGFFTLGVVLAPAMAPALAGALVDHFGWRAVPLAATPFALLAALAARWLGSDTPPVAPQSLLAGLRLPLLREPRFRRSCGVAFLYGVAMFASAYLIPVFVQIGLAHSASAAGAVMLPAGLALAAASPFGGSAADRWPRHLVISAGLLTVALAHALLLGLDAGTPLLALALLMIAARLGMALVLPSLSLGALTGLPSADWSAGSTLVSLSRQLGAALGVGCGAVFLQWRLGAVPAVLAFHQTFALVALVCIAAALLSWRNAPRLMPV